MYVCAHFLVSRVQLIQFSYAVAFLRASLQTDSPAKCKLWVDQICKMLQSQLEQAKGVLHRKTVLSLLLSCVLGN